jgi:hypothetical protein
MDAQLAILRKYYQYEVGSCSSPYITRLLLLLYEGMHYQHFV